MSEIVLYVVCFALGCAVGWFVALWGFEKVIRLLARVYEDGDTESDDGICMVCLG